MSVDLSGSQMSGERHMPIDVRRLASDSLAILRRFDPRALVIAIVSTLVLLALSLRLETGVLLLPILGAAIYVGVALLWERPEPTTIAPDPPTLEEAAFSRMRCSTTRVLEEATRIKKTEVQQRVTAIGKTFNTMLDVMEEDKDRTQLQSAPDYEVRVVGPFEQMLDYYVYLSERGVDLSAALLTRFEEVELARYEVLTQSFYQHYHDDAVIDFAALLELFEKDDETEEYIDNPADAFDRDDDEVGEI